MFSRLAVLLLFTVLPPRAATAVIVDIEGTYFNTDFPSSWFSRVVEKGAAYMNQNETVEIAFQPFSLTGKFGRRRSGGIVGGSL